MLAIRVRYVVCSWMVCVLSAVGWGQNTEEFVGPFPSWKNVKADYGAVGDGKADDTAAIQKGLDDLRLHKDSCVLYFPAGTYRITDTLKTERTAHTECMGIAVTGEDPARTVIKWDGPTDGSMLQYDAWYSKISRLTLDGVGKAKVALQYGNRFSTYNETSDMVFRDVAVGLSLGGPGSAGQAENAVLRCTFQRCTDAGLSTNGFNCMDIWAWYCRFEDCGYGLLNRAGNWHAYECLFLRSTKADARINNLMVFSLVNNTSVGSACFIDFTSGHSWGAPTSITGNRVIEPTGPWAIRLGNGGPYLVAYNTIKARPGAVGPVAEMTWGDQAFVGNTYTVANPVKTRGRFRQVGERVVAPATVSAAVPELPPTPPNHHRPVIEVAPTADAAAIQAGIDQAAALRGKRPVVHLPKGVHALKATLVIPAGSDLQLVGDGGAETATVLRWAGAAGGTVLRMEGPSQATVRDLMISAGDANGIQVTNCDQPGGKVFTDQLNTMGIGQTRNPVGLRVNGVEQSDVLLRCLQGAAFCRRWVEVLGGPLRQASQEAPGQVTACCGATGTAEAHYAVEKGGQLVVRSIYHEVSGEAPQAILLNDSGTLCVDATRFSYKTAPDRPLIKLDGFRGAFTLLTGLLLPVNSPHTARVEVAGDGSATKALVMSNLFWVNELGANADTAWRNVADPPAKAAMLLCNVNSGLKDATRHGGYDIFDDRGQADDAFIEAMLQPLRQVRLWTPGAGPGGVTNVQLHRVICAAGKGAVGVELAR